MSYFVIAGARSEERYLRRHTAATYTVGLN